MWCLFDLVNTIRGLLETPTVRKHGWQWPLHPLQLLGAFVYFFFVVGFAVFMEPMLKPMWLRGLVLALYSGVSGLVAIFFVLSILINPSDPVLRGGEPGSEYCNRCQLYVRTSSKHCRYCNKCCEGFDHHCPWLNNCIARRNYCHFFALLSLATIKLAAHLCLALHALTESIRNAGSTKELVKEIIPSMGLVGYQVVISLQIGVVVILLHPVGTLLLLHIVLRVRKMSTYEFIVMQRQLVQLEELHASALEAPAEKHGLLCWRKYKNRRVKSTPQNGGLKKSRRGVGLSPWDAWRIHRLLKEEKDRAAARPLVNVKKANDGNGSSSKEFELQAGFKTNSEGDQATEGTDHEIDVESGKLFYALPTPLRHEVPDKNPSRKLPPLKVDAVMDVSRESSIIWKTSSQHEQDEKENDTSPS